MGRVIAIAIPKGGVGKTTTAVNLSASLAVMDKKVLLIDTDPFGACAMSLGISKDRIKSGLYEAFNFVYSISQVIHHTEIPMLDLVPINVKSVQEEERMLRVSENRTLLKNLIRSVVPLYDYIIIDTPPVLRGLTTNALVCADSVLIPIRAGNFSIEGIDKLFRYFEWIQNVANKPLLIEGILQTMYEPHTRATEITEKELQSKYQKYLLRTIIPKNTILAEASFYGKPAILFNASSKSALAYLELASELMEKHKSLEKVDSITLKQEIA